MMSEVEILKTEEDIVQAISLRLGLRDRDMSRFLRKTLNKKGNWLRRLAIASLVPQ